MIFYELTTDVFKDRFDRVDGGATTLRAGAPSARRPLRGLEVKEDTFAMLKVIDLLGREIKLYNSSYPTGRAATNTNFILQAVQEPRSEKYQLVETFGEPYIFLYGEAPRFLTCSCILIDSLDFNWQAEFWANYDKYLRGSKCAENGARVYLFYNDNIVEGYMVKANAMNESMNPMAVQMQFDLFVTNYRNISMIGDPAFPIRLGVNVNVTDTTGTDRTSAVFTSASGVPLRSNIADNLDEWTGEPPNFDEESDNTAETDDLIKSAVEAAARNAANMNSVDAVADAGLDKANKGTGGGKSPPERPTPTTVSCDPATTSGCPQDPNAPCGGLPVSCTPPPGSLPSATTPASTSSTTSNTTSANVSTEPDSSTAANSSTVLPECTFSGQGNCVSAGGTA